MREVLATRRQLLQQLGHRGEVGVTKVSIVVHFGVVPCARARILQALRRLCDFDTRRDVLLHFGHELRGALFQVLDGILAAACCSFVN